jgi:branched-chain amino acid transport system permease protein
MSKLTLSDETRATHGSKAPLLAIVGGALTLLSGLLSWTVDPSILNDVTVRFWPVGAQIYVMVMGVVAVVLGLLLRNRPLWMSPGRGLRILGWTIIAFALVMALFAIGYHTGALANLNEGLIVTLIGGVLVLTAGMVTPDVEIDVRAWPRLNSSLEILIIVAMMAVLLVVVAHALSLQEWTFIAFLLMIIGVAGAVLGGGLGGYLGFIGANNRRPLLLAAFLVAFLFPFTQDGSDANMSIAVQIIIFAATALGLNIVVGLAGLLDLGYIAFLGTGAYVGAMLSQSLFATVGWKPPFVVVMLIGAAVAAVFGLIIGSPTLRVSGDYLAIVTLGFGEIFRLAMFNLDGNNGPSLTNGPNGIPGIPDLNFFGFDFGERHVIAGIQLGRFANYYFLLLLLIAFVILVFARLNDSRLGRGWIAIREDERAAEAMGVNTFALKLLAFAVGASLAGIAGTIKAHVDTSVSPDQYIFLESAFLLAAVVLGGMGTVVGVLVGAVILKLLPEKLREVNDYRLLMFGLLLVLMMRFRPEGLIPNKRNQLQFHEDDEELVELIQEGHLEEVEAMEEAK